MLIRDVSPKRRHFRIQRTWRAAFAASCCVAVSAGLFAARDSIGDETNSTKSPANITVSAEPVVNTQTNPFATGISALKKTPPKAVRSIPTRPIQPHPNLTANPFTTTNQTDDNPPALPAAKSIVAIVSPTNENPIQTNPFDKNRIAKPMPFTIPEHLLKVLPAANRSRSRVVDAMSLGDELGNELGNESAGNESTGSEPTQSQASLPQTNEPDNYRLMAPRSTIASPPPTHTINSLQLEQRQASAQPIDSVAETSPSSQIESLPPTDLVSPMTRAIPQAVSHGSMGRYLDPYRVRASETTDDETVEIIDPQAMFAASGGGEIETQPVGAGGFDMWWESEMMRPIGFTPQSLNVDVATLTQTALASSPYVRSLLTQPHIRRSDIVIADADFDPTVFLEGRFTDTNDPVGSALTTGDNSDRFRDETFTANGGVRKKTRKGAELELAQRGGFQENNSTFLIPNPQGTTRLEFNFTQPLMRDRGCAVNNIRILLAQLDLQINNAEVRKDLENHLIDVTRAYWDLYQARAEWLQRKRLLERAQRLHQILEARGAVDSQQRQILRARAALTTRKSDLVRITTRIRNAQSRLRLLTGSRQLIESQQLELTPLDQPLEYPVAISTRQSVLTALDNRPDIASAIRRIQSVSARAGVARNQILPRLDLILGTYVSGLDDNRSTFGAWANQFSDGRPTYWAGLAYELPVGNRANRARLNRNRWELSQVMHDFQQATEVAFTEVEVAVRETQTAYSLMVAKQQAIDAAANEVQFLQQRWELLPDPNESAVLLIEDLLEAQERLADEEQAFVAAQVAYAMSWIQLRKSMGILLRFDAASDEPVLQSHRPANTIQPASNDPASEVPAPVVVEDEIPHLSQDRRLEELSAPTREHREPVFKSERPKVQAKATAYSANSNSADSYSTGGDGFSLKDSLR